ncbi:MAG: formyltetrahydrofolate deformylase [Pseudomonadota bacterium]|nr:formyltetrahydrofolate deformylase [Pseudomonadota bacterium]
MAKNEYILRAAAPDAIGILADVASCVADHQLSILKNEDFADLDTGRFFIWQRLEAPEGHDLEPFKAAFGELSAKRSIDWSIRPADEKPRILVMVSKGDHCLIDLLYRARRDKLGAQIVAVVSNHENARWHAERHDVPFYHVPVTRETKPQAEAQLHLLVDQYSADFVVLARYMQVLSEDAVKALEGRCINIHHSALPSFKGAKPYDQAHARGVKMIGATAHYVTSDLDEGPIIAQETESVDHHHSARDLAEKGRDVEARVLSRAVTAHAEGRVFLNGVRTVVF